MRLPPQVWLVLAGGLVLLVVSAGFATYEIRRSALAGRELADAARQRVALRQEVETLEARVRHRNAASAATPAETSGNPSPSASAIDEPPLTPAIMTALRLESSKADLRSFFAPFFMQRGFNAEKIAEFAERLARNQERLNTLATELPDGTKNDPNDPVIQSFKARQKELERFFQADLESFLGLDEFARYREFLQELRFWSPVQDFAGRLHDTDTPLTPDQARQLAGVFVAGATDANGKIGPGVTDWDGVFTRAAGFLSPSQLEVLKTQHDYDETWRQLNRLSSKALAAPPAQK